MFPTSIMLSQAQDLYLTKGTGVLNSMTWTFVLSLFTFLAPVSRLYMELSAKKPGRVILTTPIPTRTIMPTPTATTTASYRGPGDCSVLVSIAPFITLVTLVTLFSAGTAYIITKRGSIFPPRSPKRDPPHPPSPREPPQHDPSPPPQDNEEGDDEDEEAEGEGDARRPEENTENPEENKDQFKINSPFASGSPDDPSDPDPSSSGYFFGNIPLPKILSSSVYFWLLLNTALAIGWLTLVNYLHPQHTRLVKGEYRQLKNLVIAQLGKHKHRAAELMNMWVTDLINVGKHMQQEKFVEVAVIEKHMPRPAQVEMVAELVPDTMVSNVIINIAREKMTVNVKKTDVRKHMLCLIGSCIVGLSTLKAVASPEEDVEHIQEQACDVEGNQSLPVSGTTIAIMENLKTLIQEEDSLEDNEDGEYFDAFDAFLDIAPHRNEIIHDKSGVDGLASFTIPLTGEKENNFQQIEDVEFFDALDTSLDDPIVHTPKGSGNSGEDELISYVTTMEDDVITFHREGSLQKDKENTLRSLGITLEHSVPPTAGRSEVEMEKQTPLHGEGSSQVKDESTGLLNVVDITPENSALPVVLLPEAVIEPESVEPDTSTLIGAWVDVERLANEVEAMGAEIVQCMKSVLEDPLPIVMGEPESPFMNINNDTEAYFGGPIDNVAPPTAEVGKGVWEEKEEEDENTVEVEVIEEEEPCLALLILNKTVIPSIQTPLESFQFDGDQPSPVVGTSQVLPFFEVEVPPVKTPQSFVSTNKDLPIVLPLVDASHRAKMEMEVSWETLDLVHGDMAEERMEVFGETFAAEGVVVEEDGTISLEAVVEPGFALDPSASFDLLDVIEASYAQGMDMLLDGGIGPREQVFPEFDGEHECGDLDGSQGPEQEPCAIQSLQVTLSTIPALYSPSCLERSRGCSSPHSPTPAPIHSLEADAEGGLEESPENAQGEKDSAESELADSAGSSNLADHALSDADPAGYNPAARGFPLAIPGFIPTSPVLAGALNSLKRVPEREALPLQRFSIPETCLRRLDWSSIAGSAPVINPSFRAALRPVLKSHGSEGVLMAHPRTPGGGNLAVIKVEKSDRDSEGLQSKDSAEQSALNSVRGGKLNSEAPTFSPKSVGCRLPSNLWTHNPSCAIPIVKPPPPRLSSPGGSGSSPMSKGKRRRLRKKAAWAAARALDLSHSSSADGGDITADNTGTTIIIPEVPEHPRASRQSAPMVRPLNPTAQPYIPKFNDFWSSKPSLTTT